MNARPSVAVQTSPECWERGWLTWEVCGQAQAGFTKGRCWISGAGSPHIPSWETLRVSFKTCSTAHKLPHPPFYTVRPRLNDSEMVGWEHIHVHSCTHTHTWRDRAARQKKKQHFFSQKGGRHSISLCCLFHLLREVQINMSKHIPWVFICKSLFPVSQKKAANNQVIWPRKFVESSSTCIYCFMFLLAACCHGAHTRQDTGTRRRGLKLK